MPKIGWWSPTLSLLRANMSVHFFQQKIVQTFVSESIRVRCNATASSLTLTTLFSLVPFISLVLWLVTATGWFAQLEPQIEEWFLSFMVPESVSEVRSYIRGFVQKSHALGMFSIAALVISVILLLRTVEGEFHQIWQNTKKRKLSRSLTGYFVIIFILPVTLIIGLTITAYVKGLSVYIGDIGFGQSLLSFGYGTMVYSFGVGIMYYIVPGRKVAIKPILICSIIVGCLLEATKQGVTLLVLYNTNYQAIFGAFAFVPIFILWIYASWLLITLGAVACHVLEEELLP